MPSVGGRGQRFDEAQIIGEPPLCRFAPQCRLIVAPASTRRHIDQQQARIRNRGEAERSHRINTRLVLRVNLWDLSASKTPSVM